MRTFTLTSLDGIPLDCAEHAPSIDAPLGVVVQAHGITSDMNERGVYVRLAERLASDGFHVVRFSFRGHGRSGGTQKGMTIAGEMLDLAAVLGYAQAVGSSKVSIVAASFGAVSACLSLPYVHDRLTGLCLWHPVLDLKRTFIEPELPWQVRNFVSAGQEQFLEREVL